MSTHAKPFLFSTMIILLVGGCATKSSHQPSTTGDGLQATEADTGIEPQAEKLYCYFHHNCPNDGRMTDRDHVPIVMTKRQCKNQPKGFSWGDSPNGSGGVCENLK